METKRTDEGRILFVAPDGSRKTIRLGKANKRIADGVKHQVEHLLPAKISGHAIDADIARWLNECEPALLERLAAVGLIAKQEIASTTTLDAFITEHIDARTDVKPVTKVIWGHTHRNLVEFFGAKTNVKEVTPGDADKFKLHLAESLAPTTVHKRLQFARTFFRAMLRQRIITENRFADVKAAATGGKDKQQFIPHEAIDHVIDACPNADWRCIVALSRYGGLRCPSEVLSLKWEDINWAEGRIVVTAPKTEHPPGKETRVIPSRNRFGGTFPDSGCRRLVGKHAHDRYESLFDDAR